MELRVQDQDIQEPCRKYLRLLEGFRVWGCRVSDLWFDVGFSSLGVTVHAQVFESISGHV